MADLQTKTISANGSKGHHKFSLTITEKSTDIANNTSSVSFDFKISPIRKDWDWEYKNTVPVSYTITINGKNYTGNIMSYDGVSTVSIRSGTENIAHLTDGSKTLSFSFSVVSNINNSVVPGNASASGSMALTSIPRKATITAASNFNDEENPTIDYSNPAGDAVDKLEACISLTGAVDDVEYREIDKTDTSYTFNLTDDERAVLRQGITEGSSRSIIFFIRTTIGSNVYHDTSYKTLTLINYEPVIDVDMWDNNPDTVALTGNARKYIRGHSTAYFTINATGRKKATIEKYFCNDEEVSYDDSILNVSTNTLVFKVEDSRGNTNTTTETIDLINYVDVSCSQKVKIELDGETEARITVSVDGNYFNGSFGNTANELFINVRYKPVGGDWSNWIQITEANTPTYSGNRYSLTATLPVIFNYSTAYVIECRATDKLTEAYSGEYTASLTPVFDWSDTDFNFNVPICFKGQEMKDFVVDEGTISGWMYRLWNSGRAECWRRLQITTAVNSAWGSLYSSGSLSSTNLSYPFSFAETPILSVSLMPFGTGGMVMVPGNGYGSATQTGPFEIVRGTITASGQFLLAYHAVGKWK